MPREALKDSIVIPLEQGLRRFSTVAEPTSVYSIVIPLEQGLRRQDGLPVASLQLHSIVIPLEQGLRHSF